MSVPTPTGAILILIWRDVNMDLTEGSITESLSVRWRLAILDQFYLLACAVLLDRRALADFRHQIILGRDTNRQQTVRNVTQRLLPQRRFDQSSLTIGRADQVNALLSCHDFVLVLIGKV
jgi:hypothetical protein